MIKILWTRTLSISSMVGLSRGGLMGSKDLKNEEELWPWHNILQGKSSTFKKIIFKKYATNHTKPFFSPNQASKICCFFSKLFPKNKSQNQIKKFFRSLLPKYVTKQYPTYFKTLLPKYVTKSYKTYFKRCFQNIVCYKIIPNILINPTSKICNNKITPNICLHPASISFQTYF